MTCLFRASDKNVNSFYLDIVNSGELEDLQALFDCVKSDPYLALDKNYVNERGRDALKIAIDNEDVAMLRLLLKHKVLLNSYALDLEAEVLCVKYS